MDLSYLLSAIPPRDLIYLAALCGLCAALMPWLPAPASSTSLYGRVYAVINLLAQNFRNAANQATASAAAQSVKLESVDGDRRKLLGYALMTPAAIAGAGALSACTVTTSGGVTTITLNVSEVVTDTDVALAIAKTVLGFTGIPAGVVSIVNAGIATIQAGLSGFQQAAGSSLVLTFDRSSPPAALMSLIGDLRTVSANISAVAQSEGAAISSSVLAQVQTISADVANIGAILESIVSAAAAAPLGKTAAQGRAIQIDAIKARNGVA